MAFSSAMDMLRIQVSSRPRSVAWRGLSEEGSVASELSYGDVLHSAQLLAERLRDYRSASWRGQRVLLLVSAGGEELLPALFACWWLRAVPVVMPERCSRERLAKVCADCQPLAILGQAPALRAELEGLAAAYLSCCSIEVASLESAAKRSPVSGSVPKAKASPVALSTDSAEGETGEFDNGDIALLLYTSGSTTEPKGVAVTQANLFYALDYWARQCPLQDGVACVNFMPLYHNTGLVVGTLFPFLRGCPVIQLPTSAVVRSPKLWLETISRFRAQFSVAPDSLYAECAAWLTPADIADIDLSCWRWAVNGTEPVRARTLELWDKLLIPRGFDVDSWRASWGMSETVSLLVQGRPQPLAVDPAELRRGRVCPGALPLVGCGCYEGEGELSIRDEEGKRCTEDVVGEICLASPAVAGYFTEMAAAHPQECLRTGDLGFLHGGQLYISGRRKEMIKIHGRPLHPVDVEAVLLQRLPQLAGRRVVVLSLDDGRRERLVSLVEATAAEAGNCQELVGELRAAIWQEYGLSLELVEGWESAAWPLTLNGKIARRECRRRLEEGLSAPLWSWAEPAGQATSAEGSAEEADPQLRVGSASCQGRPEGVSEFAYLEFIKDWLGRHSRAELPAEADSWRFSEFGLTSLSAGRLVSAISERFDLSLPLTALWSYPSPVTLAAHLASLAEGAVAREAYLVEKSRAAGKVASERKHQGRAAVSGEAGEALGAESDRRGEGPLEPLAIVGLGCRFPGHVSSPQDFWQFLCQGEPQARPMSYRRRQLLWEPGEEDDESDEYRAAYLEAIERFEGAPFHISANEVPSLDPQLRMLLSVSAQAWGEAGIVPAQLAWQRAGVYIGAPAGSFAPLLYKHGYVDSWFATGNLLSAMAGRMAYAYDVHGPAVCVDTACSSSLSALHLATEGLRTHQCDIALVGGARLYLSRPLFRHYRDLGMLSPDGITKTFSASADGYGRGEGCAVLILQRLSEAVRDRRHIWAVVWGSALNHDGYSNGFTAPNGQAQRELIAEAWRRSELTPDDMDYLEIHGAGTQLGDPIEINALDDWLREREGEPLRLGALKSCLGHLEGAAGLAGVVKVALALHNRCLPPSRVRGELNPHCRWQHVRVQDRLEPWEGTSLRAGVSSFGLSGSNAHVVLQDAPSVLGWPIEAREYGCLESMALSSAVSCAEALDASPETSPSEDGQASEGGAIAEARAESGPLWFPMRGVPEHFYGLEWVEVAPWDGAGKEKRFAPEGGASYRCWHSPELEIRPSAAGAEGGRAGDNALELFASADGEGEFASRLEGQLAFWRDACASAQGQAEHRLSVVYRAGCGQPEQEAAAFLAALKTLATAPSPARLLLLTVGTKCGELALPEGVPASPELSPEALAERVGPKSRAEISLAQASLWALARAARVEYPQLDCFSLDIPWEEVAEAERLTPTPAVMALLDAWAQEYNSGTIPRGEDELLLRAGRLFAPRFRARAIDVYGPGFDISDSRCPLRLCQQPWPAYREVRAQFRADRSYLITGGTGGLGLALARFLVERGARHIGLLSRSGRVSPRYEEAWRQLQRGPAQLELLIADVADSVQLEQALARLQGGRNGKDAHPLDGVFHLAGEYSPRLLADLDADELWQVWRAKVRGALNLHRLTSSLKLSHFVLYSSLSTVLLSPGQGAYASANAFLESLARWRRLAGLSAQAISWGTFADVGMMAEGERLQRLSADGVGHLHSVQGLSMLEVALEARIPQVLAASLNIQRWLDYYPQWQRSSLWAEVDLKDIQAEAPALTERTMRGAESATKDSLRPELAQMIARVLGQRLSAPEVLERAEVSFHDLGLDSLQAVELRNLAQKRYHLELPVTLAFEHPNLRDLAGYLHSLLRSGVGHDALPGASGYARPVVPPTADDEVAASPRLRADDGVVDNEDAEPIAIVGLGCRLPGDIEGPQAFWQALCAGRDLVAYPGRERRFTSAATRRYLPGGYLRRIDLFDAQAFAIGDGEAASMAPQQRLLLETCWQALEDGAISPAQTAGWRVGVFVGMSSNEFLDIVHSRDGYTSWSGTGVQSSAVAGRLAYTWGWSGPALVVDTACSSSLVAVHLACQSLRRGECNLAVAAGVNVIAGTQFDDLLSKLGAISPSGRCRTFSAQADGFVRGEGCGVVVLKRLSEAWRDGDPIHAIIGGTAVNQDGHSNGFSAPSLEAQREVVRLARREAGWKDDTFAYVEAHGTGTPLGDPLELRALQAELGERRGPLWVGTVKTNLGHLEGASGVVGLIKAALCVEHGQIPPSLHCQERSADFDWRGLDVPRQLLPWPEESAAEERRAGVSAFGLAGTNAHVVVSGLSQDPQAARERGALHRFERSSYWFEPLDEGFISEAEMAQELGGEPACYSLRWQPEGEAAVESHKIQRLLVVGGGQRGLAWADSLTREGRQAEWWPELGEAQLRGEDMARVLGRFECLVFLAFAQPERALEMVWPLCQRWISADWSLPHTQLLWATRGAVALVPDSGKAPALPVAESSEVMNLASQGRLWGLARTCFLEQPQIALRLVDLSGRGNDGDWAEALAELEAELDRGALDRQICRRDGRRWLARWRALDDSAEAKTASGSGENSESAGDMTSASMTEQMRRPGYVLVSGASGTLSADVCPWLCERGCRQLLLWYRRQPQQTELARWESLRQSGVEVRPLIAAQAQEVAELISSEHLPLAGLVHLAGLLDDGVLGDLTLDRFQSVQQAKTGLLAALRPIIAEQRPFMILFSALASAFGSAGQGTYCAANGALDSAGEWWAAQGYPCLTIAWGPWTKGMGVSSNPVVRKRLSNLGFRYMRPALALGALRRLWGHWGRYAVASLDWERYLGWLPEAARRVFADIPVSQSLEPASADAAVSREGEDNSAATPGAAETIAGGPDPLAASRALSLSPSQAVEGVRLEVSRLLGVEERLVESQRPFSEQGFDSLMAIELRNLLAKRFARPLPATIAFDYPTPASLGRFLAATSGDTEPGADADNASTASLPSAGGVAVERLNSAPGCASSASGMSSAALNADSVAARHGLGVGVNDVCARNCNNVIIAGDGDDGDELPFAEDIAIVGLACRLPGGVETPEQFWELLWENRDPLVDVPLSRWDWRAHGPDSAQPIAGHQGGFLEDIDLFAGDFFGISPREARTLDPQQRLVLENTWRALENANIAPSSLQGRRVGVYMGVCTYDYGSLVRQAGVSDPWAVTGIHGNALSGRVAYLLGLEGPALTLDTACSSSLVAVDLACRALLDGECELALAGGANAILDPVTSALMTSLQALSPTSRCRVFDRDADGYVRSEGCGLLVLKRLSAARRDGDRVWARICASAMGQDGRSNGLTAPRGPAQERVMRRALRLARLRPEQVGLVEAHGVGTPLSDPMELQSLQAVYGRAHRERKLWVGAVKSNIGHTEAAAGVTALIKAVLCLNKGCIPANLHCEHPTELVDWEHLGLILPRQNCEWPSEGGRRFVGLNGFGISGTNIHMIVGSEEAEVTEASNNVVDASDDKGAVLVLSAPNEAGLYRQISAWLESTSSAAVPIGEAAAVLGKRQLFEHRLAVWGRGWSEVRSLWQAVLDKRLLGALAEDWPAGVYGGKIQDMSASALEGATAGAPDAGSEAVGNVLLFTGQGSQYHDMGRELYDCSPAFRRAFDECAALVDELSPVSLKEITFGEERWLERADCAQLAIFSLEYSLWRTWESWGLRLDTVFGHSLGEFVAACVAGVFTLAEGMRLVAKRGQLMQSLPPGAMVAVWASEKKVLARIGERPLFIAAINSPMNCVVSGSQELIDAFCAELSEAKIHFTRLPIASAGHSPLLKPMLGEFAAVASRVKFCPPRCRYISALTGKEAGAEVADSAYWTQHLMSTVRFSSGMRTLSKLGARHFLEIGAQPALSAMGAVCLLGGQEVFLPSLRPGQSDWATMCQSWARLLVRGALEEGRGWPFALSAGRVSGTWPGYAWERRSYWYDSQLAPSRIDRECAESNAHTRNNGMPTTLGSPSAPSLGAEGRSVKAPASALSYAPASPTGLDYPSDPFLRIVWENCDVAEVGELSGESIIIDARPQAKRPGERASGGDSSASWPGGVWLRLAEICADASSVLRGGDEAQLVHALGAAFLAQLQDIVSSGRSCRILLLTEGAQGEVGAKPVSPSQAALWAMARVAAIEYPALQLHRLDWQAAGEPDLAVLRRAQLADEDELCWDGKAFSAPRFVSAGAEMTTPTPFLFDERGIYLVSGGTGGLGSALVERLLERGAGKVLLLSRHGGWGRYLAKLSPALRERVTSLAVDVSDLSALQRQLRPYLSALRGVFHLAGQADLGLLVEQSGERLHSLLRPKADGAWNLHRLTAKLPLDCFVVYSSVGASLVSPGQITYAAANGFLDGLMAYRHSQGLPALAISWSLFTDRGMGVDDGRDLSRLLASGLGPLTCDFGLDCLWRLLPGPHYQMAVFPLNVERWLEYYPAWSGRSLLEGLAPRATLTRSDALKERWDELAGQERQTLLLDSVRQAAARCLGFEDKAEVALNRPFRDMGLDSLMAVELRGELERAWSLPLPITLVFDCPTVAQVASFLQRRLEGDTVTSVGAALEASAALAADSAPSGSASPVSAPAPARAAAMVHGKDLWRPNDIAIVGMACHYPGDVDDLEDYWQLLLDGVDAVGEIPPDRFDMDAWYDPNPRAEGKTYCRQGGFLGDLSWLDMRLFGISPLEAKSMDPHQALLLQTVWEAWESAGVAPTSLAGSDTGVYVGMGNLDYSTFVADWKNIDSWTGTGLMPSVLAGRVSFVFGLNGPAVVIDTACSSSLVAVNLACQALKAGECEQALACGVNLVLSPYGFVFHSRLGGLARDGRCKSFDASADGLSRSDGCGVLVLKTVEKARRDGDRVMAVIRGCAVNQDGRSNGLTAPSAPAQVAVMSKALRQAGVTPEQVAFVEGHGTGTPLGDPIELQALGELYGRAHSAASPLWVGSVKSNFGHSEGASGIAALIKGVLALNHQAVPRNIHFNVPTPHVDWRGLHLAVPTETLAWPAGAEFAGISNFGISGTNAHAILQRGEA